VSPLDAGTARQVIEFRHLAFLSAGGDWDELTYSLSGRSLGWRYRILKSGVKVETSPHGSGRVPWPKLRGIVAAGLTPERSKRVLALARFEWTDWDKVTPDRLRRAGLRTDAEPRDVRSAIDAVTVEVIEAGIAATGGVQLDLFGGAA
jgi:hypothetical protein